MKKSIAYYLQDLARLSELSSTQLQEWSAAEPYSQPLRKLLHLRAEMDGQADEKVLHENAAYHVVDLDTGSTHEAANQPAVVAETPTPAPPKVIAHSLATDTLEALVELEVVEELSGIEDLVSAAITHRECVPTEAIVVPEVAAKLDEDYTLVLNDDEGLALPDVTTYEADPLGDPTVPTNPDLSLPTLAVLVPDEPSLQVVEGPPATEEDVPLEPEIEGETYVEYDEEKLKVAPDTEDSEALVDVPTTEEEPEPRTASDVKEIRSKLTSNKGKTKSKKKKKTSTDAEVIPITEPSNKKAAKGKSSKGKKAKSTKAKVGGKAKKRYIYLEEPSRKEFNTSTYDGDSDYIKWLMKTKSINEERTVAVAKTKKSKKSSSSNKSNKGNKAKKDKKSIVLKTAAESVKKRDVIISETLADILAAQGHSKKARKMYKQLSLIFPEKSTIFAAKIKKLKKK